MMKKLNHTSPITYHPSRAFTLVEMMAVVIIISMLLLVMVRIYKINSNYETAHQVDEFVKSVDKGLFIANVILQNYSFRNSSVSGNEGDNGGLYLMVPDTSFNSVYNALMKGDCMVRCFDSNDTNNLQCGGNAADFNGMCQNDNQANTLCLEKIFDKKYVNTYMMPTIIQGRISFDDSRIANPNYKIAIINPNYQVVKDSKSGSTIAIGQLVKLNSMVINLSDNPAVIDILQNIDSRYKKQGNAVVYPLNNGAGHLVIVRNGYVCQ
jgi:prepilin-type N-terminal cleavage/methylation domain-containing protein